MKRWFPTLLVTGLLLLTSLGVAAAASTTVVVTNDDVARQAENTQPTSTLVLYTRTAASLGTFVTGPGAPPSGIGSLELVTPGGGDKVFLFSFGHAGTALANIDAISYATYRTAGAGQQLPSLNIQIDHNGDAPGGFATLVFEPVYNTGQGAVVNGQWQTWDAVGDDNLWWSTQPLTGMCAGAAYACMLSWDDLVALNPDAVILGGFGVNQGSGNGGLTAAVDALTLGVDGETTVYDFEPYRVAATGADCKNGGWQSVKRADGSGFRNQGDCIQYVNTGK